MDFFAYTRNNGSTVLSVKAPQDIADTTGLGFTRVAGVATPDASHAAPPKGFKPRKVYLHDPATGRNRAEIVATAAAYATLLAGGATVDLFELNTGTPTTWNVTNGRDEHFSRGTVPHLIH